MSDEIEKHLTERNRQAAYDSAGFPRDVTAPVPSDIDGPASEANDLIERKVWRRVRDDGRVTFWETEVPDGELFVPAARLAELQQERDSWKSRSDEAQRWSLDHHAKWKVVEALASSLTGELTAISNAIGSVRFMDPPDGGSVTLAEQVERMRVALEASEALASSLQRRVEELTDERDRLLLSRAEWKAAYTAALTPPEQGKPPQ